MMKQLIIAACLLAAGPLRAVAGDFLPALTAEERAALGLQKLTAGELAGLEAAVQRYKSGEVAAVETRVRQEHAAGNKEAQRKNYWAILFGEVDPAQFVVESTLPGEFDTFDGRPMFKLANGQLWRALAPVDYTCFATLHDPRVTVKPGALGSFWLEIKGGPRVKVQPVRRD